MLMTTGTIFRDYSVVLKDRKRSNQFRSPDKTQIKESPMAIFHHLLKMFRVVVFCLALSHALGAINYVYLNGTYDFNSMPYIVGGEVAEDGKYPYQVSLFAGGGANKFHVCGASILTKNWVMTASHCCAAGAYRVLVGSNSLSSGGAEYDTTIYKFHPKYDAKQHWRNDICLIKMATPIRFNSRVQQVVLPPQGKELKEGDLLTVTGWGRTDPDKNISPDKLQVGKNFKFISLSKCGSLTNVTMFEGYLCVQASREGQGVCMGDSGGPIVKDGVQYGIASFVFMPCGSPLPDVYARVPNYIDWIKKTIGADANDLKFST